MRIVIVEDEAPIRNGMGKILEKINPNYELVGQATNGLDGLEVIEEQKPDLIIMDIRMQDMDGLTMLRTLREKGNTCLAIVLSAYSEFTYAKEAIELGIENYLLKPIKLAELEETLALAEGHLHKKQQGEKLFSLENVLQTALGGQLTEDESVAELLHKSYGFDAQAQLGLFMIWLGDYYEEYATDALNEIERITSHNRLFRCCALSVEEHQHITVVLYQIRSEERVARYLSDIVVPAISRVTKNCVVTGLHYCVGLGQMYKESAALYNILDFNLLFDDRRLINYEEVETLEFQPFKYSLDLENRVKQAISKWDEEQFSTCFDDFLALCDGGRYHPKELKEACLHFCYAVFHAAQERRGEREDVHIQTLLSSIMRVMTREQLEDIFRQFFEQIHMDEAIVGSKATSRLVRRAQRLLREHYSQGITLEEISRQLSVSDEYLSTQFKKETGLSFTETIRHYRMDKVKELLRNSDLKLTQIAEQAGYSDPKYMSKVFKEETGILPLEYRKMYI